MQTYNVNEGKYESTSPSQGQGASVALSLPRIFLYLALGLGVTFGVAYGWPYLALAVSGQNLETANVVNFVAIIASFIYMLIGGFMLVRRAFKKKSASMPVMYYLYTVAMGILCSSIFYIATEETFGDTGVPIIAIAFGITAGCMLLCALIAFLFRNKMNILMPIVTAAVIGALIITLVNAFILGPIAANSGNPTMVTVYWVLDFVVFGIILLMTAVDLYRIKKMADLGWVTSENNLAYYAAFTIYVDFIAILIRVIYYLLLANRNN